MYAKRKSGSAIQIFISAIAGLILLGLVLLLLGGPWVWIALWDTFDEDPPAPIVNYGEFPFEITFECNGELFEIEDALAIQFIDSESDFELGDVYEWDVSFKNGLDETGTLEVTTNTIELYKNSEVRIYFVLGSPGYYMNVNDPSYEYGSPGDVIILSNGNYRNATTELLEEYGIKIIRKRISSPIDVQESESVDNTFEYTQLVASAEITRCTDFLSETITLPAKINGKEVTALGDHAFYGCINLQTIYVPASVRYMGTNPFFHCSSLREITVEEGSEHFISQNGVLYDKEMTALLTYPEGKAEEVFYLPKTVTRLASNAFGKQPRVKAVYLHERVTEGLEVMSLSYPEDMVFYVKAGSAAEQYAQNNPTVLYRLY